MSAAQEITELRKGGHLAEAYNKGYELLQANPDDEYLKSAIGWVLYEKVKALVNEAKKHPNSTIKLSEGFRSIFREYAKLNLSRPDLLFSLLLSQAAQFPDDLIFLPKVMMWAGLDSFRSEDFIVQTANGSKTYESLVEKVARTVGKVARNLTLQDFPDIKEIQTFSIQLIDTAIQKTDLQKPEFLNHSKGLLLHSIGESTLAQDILIPFVRSKCNDWWTWEALASVVETNSPKEAITLYVKACLSCHEEGYSVNALENLSYLAANQQELPIAKWAAHRAFRIRKQKEYSIPPSLTELTETPWYDDESVPLISEKALAQLSSGAEMFIQAGLPQYNGNYIDSFTNKKGKKVAKFGAIINGESQELTTLMRTVQSDLKLVAGEPVKLTVDAAKERLNITAVNQRQAGTLFDSMRCISGQFRLHPKGFGFVDKAYVPHEIARQIDDRQHVSVAVVKKLDKKKNQWGFTAIAIVNGASH